MKKFLNKEIFKKICILTILLFLYVVRRQIEKEIDRCYILNYRLR